jgi:hypothetical protein
VIAVRSIVDLSVGAWIENLLADWMIGVSRGAYFLPLTMEQERDFEWITTFLRWPEDF